VRIVIVRYQDQALVDIDRIHRYIEEHNPRAAMNVVARIRSAANRLGIWPRMGHAGQAPGTYEWVVVGLPYIIVYEIIEAADEVAIVAVFHAKQDRSENVGEED
jgi:toxin ParE1/3/4